MFEFFAPPYIMWNLANLSYQSDFLHSNKERTRLDFKDELVIGIGLLAGIDSIVAPAYLGETLHEKLGFSISKETDMYIQYAEMVSAFILSAYHTAAVFVKRSDKKKSVDLSNV